MIHRKLLESGPAIVWLIIAASGLAHRLIHGVNVGGSGTINPERDTFGVRAGPTRRTASLGYGLSSGLNPLSVWLGPLRFLNINDTSFIPNKHSTRAIIQSSRRVVDNSAQGPVTMIGVEANKPLVIASEAGRVLSNEAGRNESQADENVNDRETLG